MIGTHNLVLHKCTIVRAGKENEPVALTSNSWVTHIFLVEIRIKTKREV